MRKNGKGKNLRELSIDTSTFETYFAEDWVKLITPSMLQKAGFKKIDNETYNKSFSLMSQMATKRRVFS